MNILAIDTTTKIAAVALKKENEIIERKKENEITHSEKLLPLVDEVLKIKELNIKDIDVYMTLSGPGSFTGVRIGLSTLKAFAFVYDKKIFAISSLEAMGLSFYLNQEKTNVLANNLTNKLKEKYILSLIDARNDRAYYSLNKIYVKDNRINCENVIPENNDTLENISNILKENFKENFSIVSNFSKDHEERIQNIFLNNENENKSEKSNDNNSVEISYIYPTPQDLFKIYEALEDSSKYIFDSYTLDANYVRMSQAERIKNENNK